MVYQNKKRSHVCIDQNVTMTKVTLRPRTLTNEMIERRKRKKERKSGREK